MQLVGCADLVISLFDVDRFDRYDLDEFIEEKRSRPDDKIQRRDSHRRHQLTRDHLGNAYVL
jgi:hypothetical protein